MATGKPTLCLTHDLASPRCETQPAGDAVALWQRFAPITSHVQIAGCPGRHEPKTGDIDFPAFFRALDDSGYDGWVGAEYTPRTSTEAGLRWLRSA